MLIDSIPLTFPNIKDTAALPLLEVDNSDFSATRLTALLTLLILVAQGSSPCFPFETTRILMALHVFVFLLVFCLLLFLVLLWRHDWLHFQPCSLRGGVKRSTLHRLL